jgi:hypothetical protein
VRGQGKNATGGRRGKPNKEKEGRMVGRREGGREGGRAGGKHAPEAVSIKGKRTSTVEPLRCEKGEKSLSSYPRT